MWFSTVSDTFTPPAVVRRSPRTKSMAGAELDTCSCFLQNPNPLHPGYYLEAKQQDLVVLHVENLVVGEYLAAAWLRRFLLLVRLCHLDISGPSAWRQGLDRSERLARTCGVGLQTPEERQKWVVGDRLILV